jgi:hypothetical protein
MTSAILTDVLPERSENMELEIWLNSIRDEMRSDVRRSKLPPALKRDLDSALQTMSSSVSRPVILWNNRGWTHLVTGVDCSRLEGARHKLLGWIQLCSLNKIVLLHEMVHWLGGSEYDSECTEKVVYGSGSSPPTDDDYFKYSLEDNKYFKGSMLKADFRLNSYIARNHVKRTN